MSLEVRPVTGSWAMRRFIGLPARLYRGMPGWVAPLRLERRHMIDPRKAAFFEHGQARYWIAWRDGQPVGRISAQIDSHLPVGLPEGTGMFGCLDAIDDPAVTRALLEAALDWLRGQGIGYVFGPCTLSIKEEAGLLVEGHLEPPMVLNPWHPPYLQTHLEACGLQPLRDLHSWKIRNEDFDPAIVPPRLAESASRMGVVLRGLDMKNLTREIEIICKLFNDAWSDNWGFIPIAPADLKSMKTDLRPFLGESSAIFAEIDGEPVAMVVLMPNLFDITGDVGCDPSPLGWLKLGYRLFRPRFRSARVLMLGMSRRLRGSMGGGAVMAALIARSMQTIFTLRDTWKGEFLEGGWVLHDNRPLIQIMERFRFSRNRTFRLYGASLAAAARESQPRESA